MTAGEARDVLARVVAASEELAFGEPDQAAAILADLGADLAALAARLDVEPRR